MTSPLFLGIDTGGTYTDAVLYSESEGILASAKALTTRHDLAVGVAGAVETVLSD
jgi:N-methylhydantoinase A/oxoprolinase/acetone carboxylase beta subunit